MCSMEAGVKKRWFARSECTKHTELRPIIFTMSTEVEQLKQVVEQLRKEVTRLSGMFQLACTSVPKADQCQIRKISESYSTLTGTTLTNVCIKRSDKKYA